MNCKNNYAPKFEDRFIQALIMNSKLPLLVTVLLFGLNSSAQVGINNTSPNASLEISASNESAPANTDGIIVPKINEFPSSDPGEDQDGMLVFMTGNGTPSKGFYYWDDVKGAWLPFVRQIDDMTDGKSDNDGSNNGSSLFIGTNAGATDDSSDNKNVGIGYQSLNANTTGNNNTAIGYQSGLTTSTGNGNTAIGRGAHSANTTGNNNTAIGFNALAASSAGSNIAIGKDAMGSSTAGGGNIAIGVNTLETTSAGNSLAIGNNAMAVNTTGTNNAAIGGSALRANTTGANNTAIGAFSLRWNVAGEGNMAIGAYALNGFPGLGTADGNTAIGNLALSKMTAGNGSNKTGNTAVGFEALEWGTSQAYNTAIGHFAGFHSGRDGTLVTDNTFVGKSAGFAVSGIENTFIGSYAGGAGSQADYQTGNSNVFIGFNAGFNTTAGDSSETLIIENSASTTPLIYGEFDNSVVAINWDMTGSAPTSALTVNGTAEADAFKVSTIESSAPSNSDGEVGEMRVVATGGRWYIYVKVASSTWKRAEAK